MSWRLIPLAAAVALVVLALLPGEGVAAGWRIGFVAASAPVLGSVLLLAVARLTGAGWDALAPVAARAPLLVPPAALLGVVALATPLPPHLALWQHPAAIAVRAVLAVGGLALANARRARGGSTSAGIMLALYAAFVTPLAFDWLLGGVPGHAVSAAGMMLFVQQVGAACAVQLLLGGDERVSRDLAKLLVAAALGLGYLAYMDYLIVWYGDLPGRAGFYGLRGTPAMALLAALALLLGIAAPIGALALLPAARGRRVAGGSALVALLLFDTWWIGAGDLADVLLGGGVAIVVAACLAALAWPHRRLAHG